MVDRIKSYIVHSQIVLILGCALVGCATQKRSLPLPQEIEQVVPDTTLLPAFSGAMVYVLGMEWEAIYDSTADKYHTPRAAQLRADSVTMKEYLETRLTEMYPERAYRGYIDKVEQIAEQLLRQAMTSSSIANDMLAELPQPEYGYEYGMDTGVSFANYSYDSLLLTEPQLMEFIPQEQALWDTLNNIARQAQWADRQQFDSLHISNMEEENLLLSLLLWRGPKVFYRVLQSKMRAENLAHYYYGEETNSGKPGDAFKHIYVNVLLRSYTSEVLAWVVMDVYWEHAHPNAPCDHYMDAHNNVVGRHTQYRRFVAPADTQQCSDARQWLLWAEQVQHFVQDTTNGNFFHWDKQTPSFIVVPAAQQANDHNYIYWDK